MAIVQTTLLVNHNDVPGSDKTDFPVLFSHLCNNIPSEFWSNISDLVNGLDIRFYDDILKTNEYKREIAFIDTVGQILEVWIQVPVLKGSLGAVDTVVVCEVGGGTRSNDTEVWDDLKYNIVNHFQGNANDSTVNGAHGTVYGASHRHVFPKDLI